MSTTIQKNGDKSIRQQVEAAFNLNTNVDYAARLQQEIDEMKAKLEATQGAIRAQMRKMRRVEFISASGVKVLLYKQINFTWDEKKLLKLIKKLEHMPFGVRDLMDVLMPRKPETSELSKIVGGKSKVIVDAKAAKQFKAAIAERKVKPCIKVTAPEQKVKSK